MKKSIEKFYEELWTLPSSKILIGYTILLSLLISAVVLILDISKGIYLPILFGLPIAQIAFSRIDKLISTKRTLGYMLFYIIGLLLSLVIYYITSIIFLSLAIIICFIILGSIALEFTSTLNKYIKIAYAFLISIPLLIFHSGIISKNSYSVIDNFLRSYFLLGIALMFSELYLIIIRKVMVSSYKVDLIEHLKAFLLSWLSKNHDFFQDVLKKTKSEKKRFLLESLLLKFKSGKKLGLISLPIHPGPISRVGSSDLPTVLMNKNPNFFIPFHGFTTHKYDLIDREESEKLVEYLERELFDAKNWDMLETTRLITLTTENFEIKGFRVSNVPIVIVSSRKPDIIDDINQDLYEKVKDIARKMGFESIIAIDAHNSYIMGLKKVNNYDKEILNGISSILERLKYEKLENTKIGFQKISLSDIKELKDELCPGEGCVISFISNSFKNCLILIDSNNVNFDLRNKLVEKLNELGINGEICSTDTHVMTGSIMGHNGYVPFGSNYSIHEEVTNRILNTVKLSLEMQDEASVALSKLETFDLSILGSLMEAYENGTNKYIKYGKLLPYFVFIVTLVLSYIFYPLL